MSGFVQDLADLETAEIDAPSLERKRAALSWCVFFFFTLLVFLFNSGGDLESLLVRLVVLTSLLGFFFLSRLGRDL